MDEQNNTESSAVKNSTESRVDRARTSIEVSAEKERRDATARRVIPGLRLVWMNEFLAESDAPPVWFWQDLIAQGNMVIIAADAKAGKTTVLLPLIVSVVNGLQFLDRQVRKSMVLLAHEDPEPLVKARLKKLGISTKHPNLAVMPDFRLPKKEAELRQAIKAHSVDLVVIDTLGMFMDLTNENDNSEVERKVRNLSVLAHEYNVTILLLHHSSAAGRQVRGATALMAIPDVIIGLQKGTSNSRQRVLTFMGRNDGIGPNRIVCESTGDPRWTTKAPY